MKVDPNGRWVETAWDVFSLATGAKSFVDNVKAGNVGAAIVDGIGVVADAAAVVLPVVPGGVGAGIKAVRAGEKAVDAVRTGEKVVDATKSTKGAGFIVTPDGVAVPKSQKQMKEGFEKAGFPKKDATQTSERGTIYTVPTKKGKVDVRTMEGSAKHPKRAVVTHPNSNSPKTPSGKATTNKKDNHIPQSE